MHKTPAFIRSLIAASLLLVSSGCVAAIGNRQPPTTSATIGQQLIDLKKARDDGAITEAEYQAQRTKVLDPK